MIITELGLKKPEGTDLVDVYFKAETGDISCIGAPEPGDYLIFG